jgi:hypothetical protein
MTLDNQYNDIIFYTTPTGNVKVEVRFENESFWLTQKAMAELFNCSVDNISLHIKNIFSTNELDQNSVVEEYSITASDGKNYKTKFYNLDAIIAVGYRVNSKQATQFRIWATNTLREFIIKGFVLDDERLKQGKNFGKDYFDELLERIREIRASERRFYQKITDIFQQCSIDYNKDSETTTKFFATVQNKLHWAIAGKTAAEIIADRANSDKPNMGLSNYKNSPKGKILKSDVSIAKNYLVEEEIKQLEDLVDRYLGDAESRAKRQIPMKMVDWVKRLDAFLQFNEYEILNNPGKVSQEVAKKLAEKEYDKFRVIQDVTYESDFDQEVKRLKK